MLHESRGEDAAVDRERIRRRLLRRRPSLRHRLFTGPSGALTIPVSGARAIEIGRMRRSGVPRWVVVEPMEDGAAVHEPASLEDCVRIVLVALARRRPVGTGKPGRSGAVPPSGR